MSNTVISLKKSSTPSAEPTILANGELAINYADGKLFYKHANGTILPFNTTGGNAFGTVNANGTLVVAGTSEAILTLISGNNISISADDINDTITINANIAPAYDKANNSGVVAIAAFDKANTGSSNALSNTSGVSFAGTLNFPTGNVIVGNTTTNTSISPSSIVSSGSIKLSTPFFESAINVASDYTISSGYNAMSPGPISINSGVTVTVPSGSVWTVV
jgi:hypothetical protein